MFAPVRRRRVSGGILESFQQQQQANMAHHSQETSCTPGVSRWPKRASRGASLSWLLLLVVVVLAQAHASRASIWPFTSNSASSHHKSSVESAAASKTRDASSQAFTRSDASQEAGVAPAPTMEQQFHYFWNHDKIEPKVVAQEASRILADAQLHTNHKALQAALAARRSAQDGGVAGKPAGLEPTSGPSTDSSVSESVPAPVAALIPQALQHQLTSLVLQMQHQLQQQSSLLAQPRLDMQRASLMRAAAAAMGPAQVARFWMPPQVAAAQGSAGVLSPELLAAESALRLSAASQSPLMRPMVQPRPVTLPGTTLAGVPIYGPYTIQQPAASFVRPAMVRPRSVNLAPQSPQVRPPVNQAKGSSPRRKSWPFTYPFFMNSAASQPKVTVVGPPSASTMNQRSSYRATPQQGGLDKQTLLEATSNQLAAAISSHLQARAAQRRLVSLLSQVIEQPPKQQAATPALDMMSSNSLVNAHFAQPDHSATGNVPGSYLVPAGVLLNSASSLARSPAQSRMGATNLAPGLVELNNSSSNAYGNRLNRRHLDGATESSTVHESLGVQEDLLREIKNSSAVDNSKTTHRSKRAAPWASSGFQPMDPAPVTPVPTLRQPSTTKQPRQPRVLRASPLSSLTSNSAHLIRRNLSNSTASEQMTTVSSLQIPDSPLDWSTPTKRADLFKAAKVKRVVPSGSVFHHSVMLPVRTTGAETSEDSNKFAGAPDAVPLNSGPLQPITSSASAKTSQEDVMNGSAAESARVINYFQNVDSDRTTTTKAPEQVSATLRPSIHADFLQSSSANRYKSNSRKSAANDTSQTGHQASVGSSRGYLSSQGNGPHSGANYVPASYHSAPATSGGGASSRSQRQQVSSAASRGATTDISSSATRSVAYSVTNSGPGNQAASSSADSTTTTVSKPGQLETSTGPNGSGVHALVGSITRASASSNHQMTLDSSLSDMEGQDMQVKLLDSLLAKENSARSSASYPPPTTQSPQSSSGNSDRSPSADQSGSYNEELMPPSFASVNQQNFQDALEQSSVGPSSFNEQPDLKPHQEAALSQMMESTRHQQPHHHLQMEQNLAQVQSQQQTYNMTPGEWVSGPPQNPLEPAMEISSNSFQNLNQAAMYSVPGEQEPSQFMSYPNLFGSGVTHHNPLAQMYQQPSSPQQRQFYTQQLQALGSAVNRYNQNRFTYQPPSFAASKSLQAPKEIYTPSLRNDFGHLNWANLEEGLLNQMVPQSIAYGSQNVANLIASGFPGSVGPQGVSDARSYLMAGSEQSRSELGDEQGGKSKRSKSKPIKQVSHHYHINNFGFPVEDSGEANPLDIAAAFATNPGLGYPRGPASAPRPAKPAKSPVKDDDKKAADEEEEEEKPRKKKFLRRFSIKNLFKKLKKDKKKENAAAVESGDDESGSGSGNSDESAASDERRSRLY